jgi:aminopeptidase N
MKKAKMILLGLLSACIVQSQQFTFDPHHACAHSKIQQAELLKQKNIIQNPLLFDYDVRFYHLDLVVSDTTTYIEGNVEILARVVAEQLDTFVFELIHTMHIDSVLMDGSPSEFIHETDECIVILNESIAGNMLFSAKIYYHGNPPPGGFFNGVTTAYDSTWNKHVTWTLSEPFNARQWWPTKQVLDDKADSVWVFLTTDASNKAGSIGILQNEVPLPDNRIRYEWKSKYPIAYYLISYAVANYQDYSIYAKPEAMNGDSLLIQNYIYDSPGCLEQYKNGIDRTAIMIELFSDLYSLYPFHEEKYGHSLAKISGGMEHQTMTTLHEFGLLLVAHELGHMWFGDNVTCATWSDIWVNEGFATYTDYLAHEKIAGNQWPKVWMTNVHNYVMSEPAGSVYVPAEEIAYDNVERIFDSRLTYYKGALMLHMIRFELDDDNLFFQVYKNYQSQFKDSVATSLDFLDVLNQTTGKDFSGFFDQWYFGEGYPIYSIDWKQTENLFELFSSQATSAPDITSFFNMSYPVKLYFNNGSDTTIRIHQTQQLEHISLSLSSKVDSLKVDPDLRVLKKVVSINGIHPPATNPVIEVSPNPVTSVLSIRTAFMQPYRVRIVELNGTVRKDLISEAQILSLDIGDLSQGVYLLIISGNGNQYSQKILKQ